MPCAPILFFCFNMQNKIQIKCKSFFKYEEDCLTEILMT